MSLLIAKIIALLIYPLGLFFILLLIALLLGFMGKAKLSWCLTLLAGALLFTASLPRTAHILATNLESQFPARPIENIPQADTLVVLGGLLASPVSPRLEIELSETSDRLLYATRLWKAGKIKRIFLSGGNAFPSDVKKAESVYARELLIEWGVDQNVIAIGPNSKTTRENALEVAADMQRRGVDKETVLLLTSALHMPRSLAVFESYGFSRDQGKDDSIHIIPVTTDILAADGGGPRVFGWIPDTQALTVTTRAWHEMVGIWYYRLRGWVSMPV